MDQADGAGVGLADDTLGADDVVFGPAADGGFYLIGASSDAWARSGAALRAALASAPMGGPLALAHMAQAARELGLRVSELPMWTDVDEPADLAFLDRLTADSRRPGSRGCAASRCRSCVRSICTSPSAAAAAAHTATTVRGRPQLRVS